MYCSITIGTLAAIRLRFLLVLYALSHCCSDCKHLQRMTTSVNAPAPENPELIVSRFLAVVFRFENRDVMRRNLLAQGQAPPDT